MSSNLEIETLTVNYPYKPLNDKVIVYSPLFSLKALISLKSLKDDKQFFDLWIHELTEETIFNIIENIELKENLAKKPIIRKGFYLFISHILTSFHTKSVINDKIIKPKYFIKYFNLER